MAGRPRTARRARELVAGAVAALAGASALAGVPAFGQDAGPAIPDQGTVRTDAYWWVAALSHDQTRLTVLYSGPGCVLNDSGQATVTDSAPAVNIQVTARVAGGSCGARPRVQRLQVSLPTRVAGRPIYGQRNDPRLPGGTPHVDVAGRRADGRPAIPRVVGLQALDAKLALRMARLIPHARTAGLSDEVVRQSVAGGASRRVLLGLRASRAPASAPSLAIDPDSPTTSAGGLVQPSASSCAGAFDVPTLQNVTEVGAATFCLVNQARVAAGLPALKLDGTLLAAAVQHSLDMAVNDYFSHTTPSGETLLERLQGVGYPQNATLMGENIAWGTLTLSTPASIVAGWLSSAPHRANILNPAFRGTGIAVVPQAPRTRAAGQAGATYTEDFGSQG
jgi:uncharacterized protein YkwD